MWLWAALALSMAQGRHKATRSDHSNCLPYIPWRPAALRSIVKSASSAQNIFTWKVRYFLGSRESPRSAPRLCQRLVEVVVDRRVAHKLPMVPRRCRPGLKTESSLSTVSRSLASELGSLADHAQAALPALISVRTGLQRLRTVEVVGPMSHLSEAANRSLSPPPGWSTPVRLATVSFMWLYMVSVGEELADRAFPLATVSTSCDSWFKVATALL